VIRDAAVATLALVLIAPPAEAGCPSYTTCAFQPVQGTNPDDEGWNELFTLASTNALGARSPELGLLETGPARTREAPQLACLILQPIAAAETVWQQFCNSSGITVISFDCGHGVMQVTSGAASYGPMLASSTAWNVGAGTKILINKWNAERGGPIGDSDPLVMENWYYAVWAYNGFTFGNNPDNPQHPANRPPYSGPNSLSRRSYPYQDIVWGYIRYPLGWRTTPRYPAVEVTYPAPGQVGMTPGPLPKLEPEHRIPCNTDPCPDGDCPFELIIDDAEPAFTVDGPAATESAGGYDDAFRLADTVAEDATDTTGRWAFEVPQTGAYDVDVFLPRSDRADSSLAKLVFATRGATIAGPFDHQRTGGFFYRVARAKLLAAVEYDVNLSSGTGEADRRVALDAVRSSAGPPRGAGADGDACAGPIDCVADLVCVDSMCKPGCEVNGCTDGTCNRITGLCPDVEPTVPPMMMPPMMVPPVATPTITAMAQPDPMVDEGCGCATTKGLGHGMSWCSMFALLLALRRRR